ncbi:MAG: hypothetical protein NC301_04510 [Bacteroides sp.]|nr:hypothetical protein [Bacteroides sp.]MCM1379720.1 hypothetical protein [Bacteroides sp.]MCM1446075.1 hypothetical protein [Prevotella sp.]
MKKLLYLSAAALTLLASCKAIDPTQDLEEYDDCVVYAVDTITGDGIATDYAKINLTGDMSTGLCNLEFVDLKLQPDAEVQTVRVNGLQQYMQDERDQAGNVTDILYTFFKTEGPAYTSGLNVNNLRFGWLSTVYWCHFTSERVRVWSLPEKFQTYANYNKITGNHVDQLENSICPRYDMKINTSAKTVTFNAKGVTLPAQNTEAEKVFKFREYDLENIKIDFNKNGFTASVAELSPVTDGVSNVFKITDLILKFEVDYSGVHELEYDITHLTSNTKIHVKTQLSYNRKQ